VRGNVRKTVGGALIAGVIALGAAFTAQPAAAQTVTCTPGTAIMARAVGSPRAPMLVPAQVPVNICSQNGQVIGVIPAFQAIGPSAAPAIVPTQTLVRTCAPTVVSSTPVPGGPLTSPLQFAQTGAATVTVQVASGTVAVPVLTTPTNGVPFVGVPATVVPSSTIITSTPTAFTCF
jgi:hypothetical protein